MGKGPVKHDHPSPMARRSPILFGSSKDINFDIEFPGIFRFKGGVNVSRCISSCGCATHDIVLLANNYIMCSHVEPIEVSQSRLHGLPRYRMSSAVLTAEPGSKVEAESDK